MKSRLCFVVAASLWSCAALAARGPDSLDLMQVYKLALQNDPQIREADAIRLANREAKPQALAALLPQLNATAGYIKGESTSSAVNLVQVNPSDPNSSLAPRNFSRDEDTTTKQYNVELRQTLFRWDQWVALKRADSQVAQAEADFGAASQDLMQRTAQRYFDVLAAKDTVDAADASLQAFARQLEQADKRFEVGLIAITDVQEARAAHDQSAAAVIAAKRSLATAQELLRELTGEPIGSLAPPIADLPLNAPDRTEDDWVKQALEQNLRVISARLSSDIAKQDVRTARSRHMPSVDLVVNNSDLDEQGDLVSSNSSGIQTPGPADRTSEGDSIGIQVSFPIFSGGGTSSQVRQRTHLHRAARERLERANRETERATRDAYLGVLSEISRVKSLRQALQSSQTALQATEAGFEVGTRTTVDVLDARRRLFDAQTNYSRSRYDYLLNVLRLQQATGTLNQTDLERINANLEK
jgi:outer membrane protein